MFLRQIVDGDAVESSDADRLARGQGIALWRQIEGALEQAVWQGASRRPVACPWNPNWRAGSA
jgi:hypothetical protein